MEKKFIDYVIYYNLIDSEFFPEFLCSLYQLNALNFEDFEQLLIATMRYILTLSKEDVDFKEPPLVTIYELAKQKRENGEFTVISNLFEIILQFYIEENNENLFNMAVFIFKYFQKNDLNLNDISDYDVVDLLKGEFKFKMKSNELENGIKIMMDVLGL